MQIIDFFSYSFAFETPVREERKNLKHSSLLKSSSSHSDAHLRIEKKLNMFLKHLIKIKQAVARVYRVVSTITNMMRWNVYGNLNEFYYFRRLHNRHLTWRVA